MSENKSPSFAARLPTTCLIVICLMAASMWCFDRFWLYHSQNSLLQPSDYTVSVAPVVSGVPADHQVSDDGQFSVKVMTRGTSHAMNQVTPIVVFTIMFGVAGLLATLYVARQRPERPV